MNKLKTILIGTGMLMLSYIANAQDFFNGMPGPRLTQSDCYATIDARNNDENGMYIQKAFPNIGNDTKALIALPMGITKNGFDIKGINLGVMKQKILGKELYGVAALGAFKGTEGYLKNISPQIYVTVLAKGLSVDLEGVINFDLEHKAITQTGAITLGYGNNRIRGGIYGKLSSNNTPEYGGLVRFDITKNHKFWSEAYINNKSEIKFRFVSNF